MMLILLMIFGFIKEAKANDIIVVDVRRNITLSETDTVYKDFYINAGNGSGLKKNLVVTAVRKLNIRDASGANAVGEILVPVGQLKVIAVYDHVAVAREFSLLSRDDLPMLEQIGIMSGDRIDTKGSFVDNTKPKPKPKLKPAQDNSASKDSIVQVTTVTVESTTPVAKTVQENLKVTPSTPTPTVAKQDSNKTNPVVSAKADTNAEALLKTGPAIATPTKDDRETLEKTAVSDNNSVHE
ncbi:MAG: hypothetical protein ACXVCP_06155 [Bdellovibrio sp.]